MNDHVNGRETPAGHSSSAWSERELEPWDRVLEEQLVLFEMQVRSLYARSPFYRRKLDEAGIDVNAPVSAYPDIQRYPMTTKDELRRSLALAPPLGHHLGVARDRVIQVQATSGTTGSPSYIGLTAGDRDTWSELGARALTAGGLRRGDTVLHAWSMSKGFTGGVPVVHVLAHMGVCLLPIGAEAGAHRLLTVAREQRPDGIVGTPSFLGHLAAQSEALGAGAASGLGIRAMIVGSEPGGGIPAIRAHLQETWGATCCEVLGNSDISPFVFGECLERSGMHFVGQDLVLAELVDPQTGTHVEVKTGTTGELVYTALRREASALLRFRSGDIVQVLGTECACGRTGVKVRCTGRTDDLLIVRGVNVWPTAVQSVVAAHMPRTTGAMRILVDFEGHSTSGRLRILVERGASAAGNDDEELRLALLGALKSRLGLAPDLTITDPGTLNPQDGSKARLVERIAP